MSSFERSSRSELGLRNLAPIRRYANRAGSTRATCLPDLQDAEQADTGRRVARLPVQRLCEP